MDHKLINHYTEYHRSIWYIDIDCFIFSLEWIIRTWGTSWLCHLNQNPSVCFCLYKWICLLNSFSYSFFAACVMFACQRVHICYIIHSISASWLPYHNISAVNNEGIQPKGPYLPCVSMAGRALLAGYSRNMNNESRLLLTWLMETCRRERLPYSHRVIGIMESDSIMFYLI